MLSCGPHRIEARLPVARVDQRARIETTCGVVWATVAGFAEDRVVLAPFGEPRGIACGDRVVVEEGAERAVLGLALLGRGVDGLGIPIDGKAAPRGTPVAVRPGTPAVCERRPSSEPLWTGVRTIDGLLTLARGARIGIFGPPGCGKSTLLDAIASGLDCDAAVFALVGERGGESQRRLAAVDHRTTLVCAPSNRTPAERRAAGDFAMTQAECLRSYGFDVAVIFDSLARYATALREIALACGEAAGRGGYPPSVFSRLAALVERAGRTAHGSITLIATVLSDPGEAADPLAEAARSFLDGHLVLSRDLAARGHFPALDVTASASRSMQAAAGMDHARAAAVVRGALARLTETREARQLGIVPADPALARALAAEPALDAFLRQNAGRALPAETLCRLGTIADTL